MPTPHSSPGSPDDVAQPRGVVFGADRQGQRSTSATGRAIFADALRTVAPAAATAAEREPNWRRHYLRHARRLVEEAVRSPAAAHAIALGGLRATHRRFEFVRDGNTLTLSIAMQQPGTALATATVRGQGKAGPAPLVVPYHGELLTGDALRRQLDRWESAGRIEPSFAQALWRVQSRPDWLDLSDQTIALLGAQAEVGPLAWLLRWRAQVIAVDLPRPVLWQRMLRLARAGNGALHVPLRASASRSPADRDSDDLAAHAGADLTIDAPEIAAWLAGFDGPLTVGAYAYLDGAAHARVAVAMDMVQAALAAQRRDVTLAMLATPTDAYAVPPEALHAAHERFAARGPGARLAGIVSFGQAFARNGSALATTGGASFGLVDALISQQGPNYVLAKRLQHWRALIARAGGTRVSIHVAPPSLTQSVTHNRWLAAAYRAAHRFGAEAFEPLTASALMAALLVHDLRHDEAAANPAVPLAHPLHLLSAAACHGGLWRMPFGARSALPMAAMAGMLRH